MGLPHIVETADLLSNQARGSGEGTSSLYGSAVPSASSAADPESARAVHDEVKLVAAPHHGPRRNAPRQNIAAAVVCVSLVACMGFAWVASSTPARHAFGSSGDDGALTTQTQQENSLLGDEEDSACAATTTCPDFDFVDGLNAEPEDESLLGAHLFLIGDSTDKLWHDAFCNSMLEEGNRCPYQCSNPDARAMPRNVLPFLCDESNVDAATAVAEDVPAIASSTEQQPQPVTLPVRRCRPCKLHPGLESTTRD